MKVVHLSYDYGLKGLSGAPIAATRLHKALLEAGVESHFICLNQTEPGVNVHLVPSSWMARKFFYILTRGLWVISKLLFGRIYMLNIVPLFSFLKVVRRINPDVVHAHFIYQDMLSFGQLSDAPGRLIISLHDLSGMNAVEPHPGQDCRFVNGFVRGNSTFMERWAFRRKINLSRSKTPVFVCPSRWVYEMAAKSLVANGCTTVVLPNVADPKYEYTASRRTKHSKFVILFGATDGRSSPYKGWNDLESALKILPKDMCENTIVRVFGEDAVDYVVNGISVHFLGKVPDVDSMKAIHHESDVFAFPSRQETFGQTKVEALIDGLPAVVFDRTGCAEFIRHEVNGWIAPDGDIARYAEGLAYYYELFCQGKLDALRQGIADDARYAFSGDRLAPEYCKVYSNAIALL